MQSTTQYANEQLWEKEWQKEYKYGVILFIPLEPLISLVIKLSQKYDKFQAAKGVVLEIKEQEKFEELHKTIESAEGVEFYYRKWPFKVFNEHFSQDLPRTYLIKVSPILLIYNNYTDYICINLNHKS